MNEKPDGVYILTERQLLDAVVRGAQLNGILGPDVLELQRAQLEAATNGGAVLRLWKASEMGASRPFDTTELMGLLRTYRRELPTPEPPGRREIESWTERDRLEVSRWVRALHAHAHPIAGVDLPPVPEQPEVLFEPQAPAARPAKKVGKKKASRHFVEQLAGGHVGAQDEEEQIERSADLHREMGPGP